MLIRELITLLPKRDSSGNGYPRKTRPMSMITGEESSANWRMTLFYCIYLFFPNIATKYWGLPGKSHPKRYNICIIKALNTPMPQKT
jgi:hypothetical protein